MGTLFWRSGTNVTLLSPPPTEPELGSTAEDVKLVPRGRYRLKELIGRGSEAGVYRARDEQVGRDVAVKLFHVGALDPVNVERHQAELRVLAALNHPGIVTLFDAGVDAAESSVSRPFLVLELVDGRDLRRTLEAGPLSARQVAGIGADLAEALQHAHGLGIVHRDVTPSNILIVGEVTSSSHVRAKLTDFGIAFEIGLARDNSAARGTVPYLSPEQIWGEPVGSPTDVYSLALVLLECLTGRLALPAGLLPDMTRLDRIPAIPEALPTKWRELLAVMMADSPGGRPTAGHVADALHRLNAPRAGRHSSRHLVALNASEE